MSARKTREQILRMREAGLIVWEAHQAARRLIEPGVTTAELNDAVETTIAARGGDAIFKEAPGKVPYPAGSCISVGSEIVHGIPGARKLKAGEVVSVDIGVRLKGWCADAAVTYSVGEVDAQSQLLLGVTEGALRLAMDLLARKSRWTQVARKMESYIHSYGLSIVEDLLGHGIGQKMWEPPQVPNYYTTRIADIKLKPGLVIAVEPMVNAACKETRTLADHWTIVTLDGRPSAHFEHTLALTEDGVEALTRGPNDEGWALGPWRWPALPGGRGDDAE